jgi:hypothetical protein
MGKSPKNRPGGDPSRKKMTALGEEGIEKDLESKPLEPTDISKLPGWYVS